MALPKELQSAYQRWEMTSFGDDRPSAVAQRKAAETAARQAPPPPPREIAPGIALPTIDEIEAIREAARQEGYAEGHAAGLADGHDEGLQAGHDAGYRDGLAQGRAEADTDMAHLQTLATTFGDAVTRADEAIAADVLELALHLARNMVRTSFQVRPELILPVVREAVDYLPTLQQPALLILHPDDALIVRDGIGHELDKSGWRVVEDATIERGGCRVDTASNQIDAQIASRWQRLAHAMGKDLDWLA